MNKALVKWFVSCRHALPSVLLNQVVLLTSSEDPVAQGLADKLAKRTGCKVMQVGEEPLNDLKPVVEQRNLDWKDVAYMGKAAVSCLSI